VYANTAVNELSSLWPSLPFLKEVIQAMRIVGSRHTATLDRAEPPASRVPERPPGPERVEPGVASCQLANLSIIVPTRNEAGNVQPLLQRLAPITAIAVTEIIFVDDSTDATPDIVVRAQNGYPCPVRLIHRPPEERTGGLGGAVVAGLRAAHGQWAVVMDGDLQHPPELIPELLDTARVNGLDLVVASRYCERGDASTLDFARTVVSRGSTVTAKALFPRRLRHVDDPMTGYFLVRRRALDLDRLRPNGFKILLEIVTRTPGLRIASVPFQFGERHSGESKASLREGLRFVQLLLSLRTGATAARFGQFSLVGISGLVVNSLLLWLWTETFGIYYLLSMVLATQGSTLWNFTLSEYLVFNRHRGHAGMVQRGLLFFAVNNIALLARGPIVYNLTHLGMNYLVANVVSMAVLLLLRYALADSMIWSVRRTTITAPATGDIEVTP
jgi:glycosyltransferase involved in cell wall biosynthesis